MVTVDDRDDLRVLDVLVLALVSEAARADKQIDFSQAARAIHRVRDFGPRRWLWGNRRAVRRCVKRMVQRGLLVEVAGDSGSSHLAVTSDGTREMVDGLAALELSDFMPDGLAENRQYDKYGPLARQNRRRGL